MDHEHAPTTEQRGLDAVAHLHLCVDPLFSAGRERHPQQIPERRPSHTDELITTVTVEIGEATAFAEGTWPQGARTQRSERPFIQLGTPRQHLPGASSHRTFRASHVGGEQRNQQ